MEEDIQNPELMPPGLRRAFTLRNNAARQVAVNFMPSRQLPYNTLKLRRSNSDHDALLEELMAETSENQTSDKQADIIVREMEQHQQLMEDNPEAEELRRGALRDLPQGLTMKRHVRAKLSASVSLRSKHKPISFWKRMKYRISFACKRGKDRIRNLIFSIEPWYEAIRKLEGNFGSAVGSYFYFLRALVCANAVFLAFILAFVVVPQTLHDVRSGRENGTSIGFLDFISGRGYLENSLLFYGHYSGSHEAPAMRYNLTFAYFFTMMCLYLMFFAVLCYRTAYSYRVNFIQTGGGVRHVFANKIFSGWDFGIASDHAAALNARSIYNELKELLAEQERKSITTPLLTRISHYLVNTAITIIVLTCIGGLLYGLWRFLSLGNDMPRWDIVVSSTAVAIVTVCPLYFAAIVRLEYYTPRVALYVTLARTCLLDISTLVLLFVFWSSKNGCWETSFGQEAYRLVILESFISLILLPLFEFVRGFLFKWYPTSSVPEFNIAYNSLTLIFNQAVLWFGTPFSPLLAVCVAVKFLLLFYVKWAVATYACVPARKVWRAAQTQTVMYMLVTLSLFVALFTLGSLHLSNASHECGPFTRFEYVFSVLTEGVLNLSEHDTFRSVLIFIMKPGVIAFVMLFLCVCVYYVRARSVAQRSMVRIIRQMLVLEAKDKDFLLSAIAKVSNGEWMYSPRNNEGVQNSYTWKYLNDDNLRKPSNAGFHLDVSHLSHAERPKSYVREGQREGDGDTDSSFSWQGSSKRLNEQSGGKKWL